MTNSVTKNLSATLTRLYRYAHLASLAELQVLRHQTLTSEASRWPTDDLVQRATGEALNPAHFRKHLERRYLGA